MIDQVMIKSPIIPGLTISDAAFAQPIAEALVRGGLHVLEVTMRTAAARDAIAEMARVDGAIVGAGTVLSVRDMDAAMKAGAHFIISPGLTDTLVRQAEARAVPFLPGVATASDIQRGLELGLTHFKFFPAEASGGLDALKALSVPFSSCRFCPTGGITAENAPRWLALDSVLCVGGSWLVPPGTPDPEAIAERARQALALSPRR
jgi:2-dehydro-3-deoxyphosphogluconate aldolase/(4S)-4-hydroxy-2-oxoglutarate aldolase